MKKLILIIAVMVSSMSMAQTWEMPLENSKDAREMEWYFSKHDKYISLYGNPTDVELYARDFVKRYNGSFDEPDFSNGEYMAWHLNNEDGVEIYLSFMILDGRGFLGVKND